MIQLAFLLVAGAGYLIDFTDSPSKQVLAGLAMEGPRPDSVFGPVVILAT